MRTDIHDLILLLDEYPFQLVSFGLAPNVNGFCYEFTGEDETRDQYRRIEKRLNIILNGLTGDEEKYLREKYL